MTDNDGRGNEVQKFTYDEWTTNPDGGKLLHSESLNKVPNYKERTLTAGRKRKLPTQSSASSDIFKNLPQFYRSARTENEKYNLTSFLKTMKRDNQENTDLKSQSKFDDLQNEMQLDDILSLSKANGKAQNPSATSTDYMTSNIALY